VPALPYHNRKHSFCHLGLISPTYLRVAFGHKDPKSVNIQSSRQNLFTILGSNVHKSFKYSVDEIDTCSQFHQHSTYSFYTCRSQKRKKTQLSHQYLFTLAGSTSKKAVRRTLMKLTPGRHCSRQFCDQVLVQLPEKFG